MILSTIVIGVTVQFINTVLISVLVSSSSENKRYSIQSPLLDHLSNSAYSA